MAGVVMRTSPLPLPPPPPPPVNGCPVTFRVPEKNKKQINILYVAVTRAKRRLFLNPSLRFFLESSGGLWNSLYLRGVSRRPGDRVSQPLTQQQQQQGEAVPPHGCVCCRCPALIGGGGTRADRLDRQEVIAAGSRLDAQDALLRKAAGDGGSSTRSGAGGRGGGNGCVKGVGLLYGESASLGALCCWCVEGRRRRRGGDLRGGGEGAAQFLMNPSDREPRGFPCFPYARALIRGLTEA